MARNIGVCDQDRDIASRLADETVANLARGEELALTACQRRIVYADFHRDRRRVDINKWQGLALFGIDQRLADVDLFESTDAHNVSGQCLLNLHFFQPFVGKNSSDLGFLLLTIFVDTNNGLSHLNLAADNASVSDTTEVVAIVEIRHQHTEKIHVGFGWRRDVFHDRLVKGLHVLAGLGDLVFGETLLGTGVNMGKVQLLISGTEFHEKFENHIKDLVRTRIFAVDFVDDNNGLKAIFHRLA